MKRWWSRLTGDTLFKRMFLLMWVALVASHLLAFNVAMRVDAPAGAAPPMPRVVPALPPLGGPGPMGEPGRPMEADGPIDRDGPGGFGAPHGPRPDGHGPRPLSASALWLDYLVRFVAIGIAAWFGARWL